MKRIILSILCGIIFPILYIVIAGVVNALFFSRYHLDTMQVYGRASMGLIYAPIAVPIWIYDVIWFYQFFGLSAYMNTIWFRVIWMFGFNISVYSVLSYLLFWYFGLFKHSKPVVYQDPPLPPEF